MFIDTVYWIFTGSIYLLHWLAYICNKDYQVVTSTIIRYDYMHKSCHCQTEKTHSFSLFQMFHFTYSFNSDFRIKYNIWNDRIYRTLKWHCHPAAVGIAFHTNSIKFIFSLWLFSCLPRHMKGMNLMPAQPFVVNNCWKGMLSHTYFSAG